jgi:hippurate hydrolase
VQRLLETRMRELSEGLCHAHGARCTVEYTHEFAPTVNSCEWVDIAACAAAQVAGADVVDRDVPPMMISEDFGAFLQAIPGNFMFIGNGANGETGSTPLHNASYDFNDEILTTGARYFAEVARLALKSAVA